MANVGWNKFNCFLLDALSGLHDLRAAGHTVKVFLSNEQPLATDTVKANIAEISATDYTAGGYDIQNDVSQAAGVASLTASAVTITASTATIGPFQFAVLYNDSAANDPLIGWYDWGSALTLAISEGIAITFGTEVFTVGP